MGREYGTSSPARQQGHARAAFLPPTNCYYHPNLDPKTAARGVARQLLLLFSISFSFALDS